MPEQGNFSISDLFQNCATPSLNHPENSTENNEAKDVSTLETEAQQSEDMSDSSSDIFYDYDSDSDEYYSLDEIDISTVSTKHDTMSAEC